MRGTRRWALIFLVLCLVCLAVWFGRIKQTKPGQVAEIRQGHKVVQIVDLMVDEPYEITVKGEAGQYNVIRVEHGKIAVIDANCPDKLCIHQGFIESGATPIVCLPHQLMITIHGKAEEAHDVVTGGPWHAD